MSTKTHFLRTEAWLAYIAIVLLLLHVRLVPFEPDAVKPRNIFQFDLMMTFDAAPADTAVSVYLPQPSERQDVFAETVQANHMEQSVYTADSGRISRWIGGRDADSISYSAMISSVGYRYEIPAELRINPDLDSSWQPYLRASEAIAVQHPEIQSLWQSISPTDDQSVLQVLQVIYNYTSGLETLPFKGLTDSLTALRLGAASCNGKSRLFVSLARLNGIPARLVGGIVLNEGRKKTSHQWVEVYIENQWVAFDPTNRYFAQLPSHYLELYRGDHSLFSHTANIGFDYSFNIQDQFISPALLPHVNEDDAGATVNSSINLAALLTQINMPAKTVSIFLMLPICALIITVMRNLMGLKSFGIFMPMLIASACAFVGLGPGLLGFALIVVIAFAAHVLLHPLRLLKIPRLATIISVINLATIALLYTVDRFTDMQFGLMSLFPVIIISFVADKLHDLAEERDWLELAKTIAGTLISIAACYLCLTSALLHGIFAVYPETYLLVLAAQIYMGRWTGIRVAELLRFRNLVNQQFGVMGINARNRDYVARLNSSRELRSAADKLESKTRLRSAGIPVPDTLAEFSEFAQLEQLNEVLSSLQEFVIKPNAGSQGNGILIIKGRQGEQFIGSSGQSISLLSIRRHLTEIINGNYSQLGDSDTAFLEPLIHQHPLLQTIAPYGLCDIRILVSEGRILSAMLRLPTRDSGGKANLHQGAIGAAVDLQTGEISRCQRNGQPLARHPDNQEPLIGVKLPYWQQILDISDKCSQAIPLGYMGIDICLDKERGPLVLEVNGRPGLEIQNVNHFGLYDRLTISNGVTQST
ncbi:hypothetical protein HBA55_31740 [Pseudomaricurvus alkylphenolicus]|uniref:sugar-transfer associated ATP-grasp domain-containing protein n=1 Tax=Pseudomaricurvus alkylphenolicus TaxID=1306991 RepID=UPI0014229A8D|nr:sugar-transfer associated ATP-grasp domain-containing protein [Pseudomaricurvus alkylphenolicus]NIB44215.1 hypothetical protein [Pseudomaricurvus alkylphenolicus]